jgi:hypothetical protein
MDFLVVWVLLIHTELKALKKNGDDDVFCYMTKMLCKNIQEWELIVIYNSKRSLIHGLDSS